MPRRNVKQRKIRTVEDLLRHTTPRGDCLIWTGRRYPHTGYGHCYYGEPRGRSQGAHRVMWLLTRGDIPNRLWVLHSCDTPSCVNPRHLFLGTAADNSRDMKSKDRGYRGERHHRATTDPETVRLIRSEYDALGHERGLIASLARDHGVSFHTAYQIVHHTSWRHLD